MVSITWKVIFDNYEFGGQEPLDYCDWPSDTELTAIESLKEDLTLSIVEYRVYVIRDRGGTPVYVGQSRNSIERLQHHLAFLHEKAEPTDVGAYVLGYLPESLKWRIDLYTLEDCQRALGRRSNKQHEAIKRRDIDDFERHLIWAFSPWFNRTEPQNNRNPVRPVPDPWN